jgi:hypothetical protein
VGQSRVGSTFPLRYPRRPGEWRDTKRICEQLQRSNVLSLVNELINEDHIATFDLQFERSDGTDSDAPVDAKFLHAEDVGPIVHL